MMIRTATLSLAALALIGCDDTSRRSADAAESSETMTPPAPRVVTIELGGRAGEESLRITDPRTTFGAMDTVFLAVITSNADADSRLSARWRAPDGVVVDSSGENIDRSRGTANAVTQFRVHQDEGWMPGEYTVDIWMNDMSVGSKTFTVEGGREREGDR